MLTNERIAEIRAQCDADLSYAELIGWYEWASDIIPVVLDALEAETARANANRSEAILIDQNSAAKDIEYEKETVALATERDRWKARAEALERAAVGQCFACIHFQSPSTAEPCYDCSLTALDTLEHGKHWVFDEAKFAGGGVK